MTKKQGSATIHNFPALTFIFLFHHQHKNKMVIILNLLKEGDEGDCDFLHSIS